MHPALADTGITYTEIKKEKRNKQSNVVQYTIRYCYEKQHNYNVLWLIFPFLIWKKKLDIFF